MTVGSTAMVPLLIIDDNAANLKLVSFLLGKHGYDIATAIDAVSARAELQRRRPVAILMDVQLPGISGLELTRELRQDPATRDIVIIAITASEMSGDEERALEAGCDGFISKPINTRTLPTVIAELLTRRTT